MPNKMATSARNRLAAVNRSSHQLVRSPRDVTKTPRTDHGRINSKMSLTVGSVQVHWKLNSYLNIRHGQGSKAKTVVG